MPGKRPPQGNNDLATLDAAYDELNQARRLIQHLEADLFETREIIFAVKALNRVQDLSGKVKILNSIVRERLGSDRSAFFFYWPDPGVFRLAEATNLPERFGDDFKFERPDGLFWELVCQSESFLTRTPEGELRFGDFLTESELAESGLSFFLPMVIGQEPLGFAAYHVPGHRVETRTHQYLQRFASQAAPSLKTAMLYEINQRDKQALDKTLNNLAMLYNIGRMMGHIAELGDLLRFILDEACKTTEAEKGSLMLLDPHSGRLTVRVVRGLSDEELQRAINAGEKDCMSFAPGEGIAGKVFVDGKARIVNNIPGDEEFTGKDNTNVRSLVCVPLVANDEAIGIVNITNKKSGKDFTKDDLDLMTALANQASVSIHRSQLYSLAIKDELTGLFVRRFFKHRIQEEINRADRYGAGFALIMIDIDHFKSINDTYGHLVGDEALVTISKVITDTLRSTDIPCRFGGEEFAIFLPETGGEGAVRLAERLRKKVSETPVPNMPKPMTISAGVAVYPDHGRDITGLVKSADMALYQAKGEGRNRVVLWELLVPKPKTLPVAPKKDSADDQDEKSGRLISSREKAGVARGGPLSASADSRAVSPRQFAPRTHPVSTQSSKPHATLPQASFAPFHVSSLKPHAVCPPTH
ncbi:MAG: diguanylate cyclase [Deltaproteobacteria bacterium]|nr:diguanylate cyclase [Deltaproteobacteria bacterium]